MANDIQQLERDLNFHPVRNEHPRTLTQAQIDRFNEQGYLMPFTIFDQAQADEVRDYFDFLMAKTLEAGGNSYTINGYHDRCQKLYDICANPRVLDLVEDLLGPNFVAWGSHFFCKLPHDPKRVPWHQDASYWPFTPAKTVTMWLAIDDVDRDNSAMRFIAGSHKHGHLPFTSQTENVVLNQEVVDAEKHGQIVDVELKAGQISLHSDMLIHGSEPNLSDRRRCGLTVRYASTDVRPLVDSWGQRAILCRGRDDYGHWGRPLPRPEGEHPILPDWERK